MEKCQNPRSFSPLRAVTLFLAIFLIAPVCSWAQSYQGQTVSLRIATWNVHDCSATDRKSGETILFHAQIAAMVSALRIDVIALQEVQIEGRRGADIAFLARALEDAGWPMPHIAWAKGPQSDDLAIFSRYPIEMSRTVVEPKGKDWPRPALEARIDVNDAHLYIFNAHFKAYDDPRSLAQRLAQACAMANHLRGEFGDSIRRAAIVVAGDFNTVSPLDMQSKGTLDILQMRDNTDSSDDFLSLNMKWRYFEPTYSSVRYSSITDHLIVSPMLAGNADRDSIRILDAPDSGLGFPISDHKLLVFSCGLGALQPLGR